MTMSMSKTNTTGADFVHSIVTDTEKLQIDFVILKDTLTKLSEDFEQEQKARKIGDDVSLERLSAEVAAESRQRKALEQRLEEHEVNVKKWVSALGVESKTARDRMAAFDVALDKRVERQVATDARVSDLEGIMPTKCPTIDVEKLSARVMLLQEEVSRDRCTASAAVESAISKSSCEYAEARSRIDRLHLEMVQMQADINKKALAADLLALSARADSIYSDVQLRAAATDLQSLDFRVNNMERSIEIVTEEVGRKALTTDVRGVAERLNNLTTQVASYRSQARADVDSFWVRVGDLKQSLESAEQRLIKEIESSRSPLVTNIESLSSSHKALERRHDADSERASACWVALEREISTKAQKAEIEVLNSRVGSVEQSISPFTPLLATKATVEDVQRLAARTEALESGFSTKADAASFEKTRLALSNQIARHEELHGRTQEHSIKLETVHNKTQEHMHRLKDIESRTVELRELLPQKATTSHVYSKDDVDKLMMEFYRKSEVDAQMCQVWWRFGESGKSTTATPWSPRK